jgi:hypothetical protein
MSRNFLPPKGWCGAIVRPAFANRRAGPIGRDGLTD